MSDKDRKSKIAACIDIAKDDAKAQAEAALREHLSEVLEKLLVGEESDAKV